MLILLVQWVELQLLYNYRGRHQAPEQRAISSCLRHVDSSSKKCAYTFCKVLK
jgi:hypothetical protein